MNKERLLALADHLDAVDKAPIRMESPFVTKDGTNPRQGKVGFDMRRWVAGFLGSTYYARDDNYITMTGHTCGTLACVAGHAHMLFAPNQNGSTYRIAKEALGLTTRQAKTLFTPWDVYDSNIWVSDATAGQAAQVIRHFVKTGRISWSRVG